MRTTKKRRKSIANLIPSALYEKRKIEQSCRKKISDEADLQTKVCGPKKTDKEDVQWSVDTVLPERDPSMPKSTQYFSISAQREVCHKSYVSACVVSV